MNWPGRTDFRPSDEDPPTRLLHEAILGAGGSTIKIVEDGSPQASRTPEMDQLSKERPVRRNANRIPAAAYDSAANPLVQAMMPKIEIDGRSRPDVVRKMIEPLMSQKFTSFPGQALFKMLLSFTPNSTSDLVDLEAPITSAIMLQPELINLLQSIDERGDLEIIEKCQSLIFLESTGGKVVHLMLRKLVNRDPAMELALTSLRRAYLRLAVRQAADVEPRHLQTMLTLASQCFNNQYVFYETSEEQGICAEIFSGKDDEAAGVLAFVSKVIAYAMYRPISELALKERQLQTLVQHVEDVQELIDRQIQDDVLEKDLAASITSFGRIENQVSIKVRRQYEEAPYPRWIEFVKRKPQQFAAYIKKRFPFLDDGLPAGSLDCLVAGCGTGRHALSVASKFPDAAVVAIDLSRRSLAYGKHRASRYGVANVEFFHGDLLEIKALKRGFDFIDSAGVLHHMEDPFMGLKALSEVLRPGGFMRIAVYRRSFRNRLKPAQDFVRNRMKSYAAVDLRAVRHQLRRETSVDFEFCKDLGDFYYISGFRDLFCHVRETSFTPSGIKELLRNLDLEFLGMDYSDLPAIEAAFLADHPNEGHVCDLDVYEEFEASRAEQLPSLLEFWVRKRR